MKLSRKEKKELLNDLTMSHRQGIDMVKTTSDHRGLSVVIGEKTVHDLDEAVGLLNKGWRFTDLNGVFRDTALFNFRVLKKLIEQVI